MGTTSIWKISGDRPIKVSSTKVYHEQLLEKNLEDWLVAEPEMMGELLFIVGRQVLVPGVNDRVDILALDPQGNAVIIELKRGKLRDPVDMQALRYASYISKWGYDDFEREARNFMSPNKPDFNFNEAFEEFCNQALMDEVPDINTDQRIIIVGSEVKEKLGSVALWLLKHKIDVKVVEVDLFKDEGALYFQPHVIIPAPVNKFEKTGKQTQTDTEQPWKADGKAWHLEKRCSAKTREILLSIDSMIQSKFQVDGPYWNQKNYVAYKVKGYNWLVIRPHFSQLNVEIYVRAGAFNQAEVAKRLGIQEFDSDEPLSEKIALPTSVNISNLREATDRVRLRLKEDYDPDNEEFVVFLKEAYDAA